LRGKEGVRFRGVYGPMRQVGKMLVDVAYVAESTDFEATVARVVGRRDQRSDDRVQCILGPRQIRTPRGAANIGFVASARAERRLNDDKASAVVGGKSNRIPCLVTELTRPLDDDRAPRRSHIRKPKNGRNGHVARPD
jgi:hypothetical protein